MGSLGCCQGKSAIDEDTKTEPLPELNKQPEDEKVIEEPKILEDVGKQKHKKKTKHKRSVPASIPKRSPERNSEKDTVKFSRCGFVHLNQGEIGDNYDIVSTIGHGSFGYVFKARHNLSGSFRAVKVLNKVNLNEEFRNKLMQEVEILKSLDHPEHP